MTVTQCKMARAGLGWSAGELAGKAGLARETVSRFEAGGKMSEASIAALRKALEGAGADFLQISGKVGVVVPE